MSYIAEILEEAENDMDEAFAWYEVQQIGLGTIFYENINSGVAHIAGNPFISALIYKNARR